MSSGSINVELCMYDRYCDSQGSGRTSAEIRMCLAASAAFMPSAGSAYDSVRGVGRI